MNGSDTDRPGRPWLLHQYNCLMDGRVTVYEDENQSQILIDVNNYIYVCHWPLIMLSTVRHCKIEMNMNHDFPFTREKTVLLEGDKFIEPD